MAALRIGLGDIEERLAALLMRFEFFFLEAVEFDVLAARSLRDSGAAPNTLQTDGGGQIEDDGAIRGHAVDGDPLAASR